jgi:undecaprenyl-diphosphatase
MSSRSLLIRSRWIERDRQWARLFNRASSYRWIFVVCRVTSRLSDGVLWYSLILALPLAAGTAGWKCALHMCLAGAVSFSIYALLKRGIGRPRPYVTCTDIRQCGRELDRFSFPSGHTLHSVGFSLVLAYYFPMSTLVLIPFTLLVGASRMVLGLHYPSDVLGGALVGATIGLLSVWLL